MLYLLTQYYSEFVDNVSAVIIACELVFHIIFLAEEENSSRRRQPMVIETLLNIKFTLTNIKWNTNSNFFLFPTSWTFSPTWYSLLQEKCTADCRKIRVAAGRNIAGTSTIRVGRSAFHSSTEAFQEIATLLDTRDSVVEDIVVLWATYSTSSSEMSRTVSSSTWWHGCCLNLIGYNIYFVQRYGSHSVTWYVDHCGWNG